MSEVNNISEGGALSLPKGWVETTLGRVANVASGSTPSTKNDEFWNGDIPWITPKDLSNFNNVFIGQGDRNITELGLKNSSAQLLPKNTILFSSRAPIGYVAISENEVTTNQGFKNIICDEKQSHFKYFYYLMKFKAEQIEKLSSGSTFSEASASLIKGLKINIPEDIDEQKSIAAILTAFDEKIELLQAQSKTLEELAQTIFTEWFGKYQIGDNLPDGWEHKTLGEVSTLSAGGDKPKRFSEERTDIFNIPIYSNGINNKGLYGYTDKPKINEESVTISARGTIGFVCLRFEPFVPIVRLVVAIPNQKFISSKYLYLFLKNMNILSTGTTQQQLTVPAFKNENILIPKAEIMKKFTSICDTLFSKIIINDAQIQTLTQTRDALLPKLMSGEIRVKM